ncbi:glutamine amidotransferase, partial [Escherichia coli]
MNNTKKSLKVLFIGESWHIHMIHSKGYDSFTSSKYEEGAPGGFAPIFPDTCYHLTHYWLAAVDIPV